MKSRGIFFSLVRDVLELRRADRPAVRLVGLAHDRRHHGVVALERELHRGLADRIGLLRRRSSRRCGARRAAGSRRPPSDICSRASSLTSCAITRRDAAELRMAERVLAVPASARNLPSGVAQRLRRRRRAVAVLRDALLHAREKLLLRRTGSRGTGGCAARRRPFRPASPPAAAIQPACRPMTSSTNTLVEVRAIEATSKPASRIESRRISRRSRSPGSSR